ncbi:MAG: hypothetical protein Q9223_006961 [Gallowayella weberi]
MARKRPNEADSSDSGRLRKRHATSPPVGETLLLEKHTVDLTSVQDGQFGCCKQTIVLPDLPIVLDPAIAETPFTHQGTLACGASANASYERLEFLGDSYIGFLAARLIYARFPDFPPGKLSQTQQLLTCNKTLAGFSESYGFDKRAHLPVGIRNREDKSWTKTMGDILEAYVAAVIVSDPQKGYTTVDKWLTELWEPLLREQVNPVLTDQTAKQVLAQKVMTKGCKLDYRQDGLPQKSNLKGRHVFNVKVYYTGLGYVDCELGSGTDYSKGEAGHVAAKKALQHPLLEEIMAKKKAYDLESKARKDLADAKAKGE